MNELRTKAWAMVSDTPVPETKFISFRYEEEPEPLPNGVKVSRAHVISSFHGFFALTSKNENARCLKRNIQNQTYQVHRVREASS